MKATFRTSIVSGQCLESAHSVIMKYQLVLVFPIHWYQISLVLPIIDPSRRLQSEIFRKYGNDLRRFRAFGFIFDLHPNLTPQVLREVHLI